MTTNYKGLDRTSSTTPASSSQEVPQNKPNLYKFTDDVKEVLSSSVPDTLSGPGTGVGTSQGSRRRRRRDPGLGVTGGGCEGGSRGTLSVLLGSVRGGAQMSVH